MRTRSVQGMSKLIQSHNRNFISNDLYLKKWRKSLPGGWIGRCGTIEWAPRSSDLTPMDFFLWGAMKDPVCNSKPRTLVDLKWLSQLSQILFGNPKGPVELGNPNTCAETKLCLNFILFRLKK